MDTATNTIVCVGEAPFRYRVEPAWAKFPGDGPDGEAVAVACDRRGRAYVFLRGPRPVLVYEPDGTFVRSWGEGQFVRPHGIFIGPDDTVYCTDDTVYVADRENSRLQLFSAEGRYLGEWTDVARPCQVFIEPEGGWIYVAELGLRAGRWSGTGAAPASAPGGRVSVYDRNHKLH